MSNSCPDMPRGARRPCRWLCCFSLPKPCQILLWGSLFLPTSWLSNLQMSLPNWRWGWHLLPFPLGSGHIFHNAVVQRCSHPSKQHLFFKSLNVSFFPSSDKFGRSRPLDDARHASQCGYTIHRDVFGNLELRASLISCYAQTVVCRMGRDREPDLCVYSPFLIWPIMWQRLLPFLSLRQNHLSMWPFKIWIHPKLSSL